MTGKQPLYARVERAADIRLVLALKRAFPALRLVIIGASELATWRSGTAIR